MSLSFDEEFESIGESEVRRMLLERDNANSVMLSYAPAWLSLKDSERIARIESRESETLSIAKEANRLASEANAITRLESASASRSARYAMYAAVIAVIGTIIAAKSEIYELILKFLP